MTEVVKAIHQHLAVVEELQIEADLWDAAHGFEPMSFRHTAAERRAFIAEHVVAGRQYLIHENGRWVGSFRVSFDDTRFWGPAGTDGLAGYLHGIRRRLDPDLRGWGLKILAIVENHILAHGKQLARLDCRAENERLRRYYSDAGYETRGEVNLENGWRSIKFEKSLTTPSRQVL